MSPNSIDRRTFLCKLGRISVGALGIYLLPACTGTTRNEQTAAGSQNFYLANKSKLMKEIDDSYGYVRKVSSKMYGKEMADTLVNETLQRFDILLPDLPYIGGYANSLTTNLFQCAAGLALYQTMLAYGKTLEETGEILYRATEMQYGTTPLGGMMGGMSISDFAKEKMQMDAERSHERQYSGDWVFDFIDGNGKDFDYGIDYTECGICKYYQAHGAAELIPYMCLLDYPISKAANSGLVRTTTIGRGGSRCDFRYLVGRPVQIDWVPDFLKKG
jgi:hypothetical protein